MNNYPRNIKDLDIYPLTILENIFPYQTRRRVLSILKILIFLNLLLIVVSIFTDIFSVSSLKFIGFFMIIFSIWVGVYFLEFFFRSLYFRNSGLSSREKNILFEIVEIFYKSDDGDMVKALIKDRLGREIFSRLGFSDDELSEFISSREKISTFTFYDVISKDVTTMQDLVSFLYENDKELADLFFRRGISKKDLIGATEWVTRFDKMIKFSERWWSVENLARIGSVAGFLAYGRTFQLDKYGGEIIIDSSKIFYEPRWSKEVDQIRTALMKSRDANVLVVGEGGIDLIDIIHEFVRGLGSNDASIDGKRIFLIDTNLLEATTKEKGLFEKEFIDVLSEAERAGNLILVFRNFSSFVVSMRSLGVDVVGFMRPYFDSPNIHFIILAEEEEYHRVLSTESDIATNFEKVTIREPDNSSSFIFLLDMVPVLESRYGIFFTYPAIKEIFQSAENYITDGVMPEKAIDLITEIATHKYERKDFFIDGKDVLDFVRIKTNIPVGEIDKEEKEKLINLEDILHSRVVGQNEAISAIANTMRRSRAGIRDPKKPIGSFFFFGPTGVGKTETAKTLAQVFFGSEDSMLRFDMSEYQSEDSVNRLIGGFESEKPGTLTTAIKNSPYGVLLLDEFEKAHKDVQNLFLQVLDEGFFSDMLGHRVNARNLIIIATSNAGSQIIYEAIRASDHIHDMRQHILDIIIAKGVIKPELLNRFDNVILFNSLGKDDIEKIAKIMSGNLKRRLREEQGIDLTVNNVLIEALMKEGQDPMFGGRPMARAIKNKVEKVIAEKIIKGEISTGSVVELTAQELV